MRYRRRVLLCVGCVLLVSCARQQVAPTPPKVTVPVYDRDFLQNRIAHQQAVIEMARTCLQKTMRDELKQFCSALSRTETGESEQLQAWLTLWYGISSQPAARERDTEGYRNFLKSVPTATGAVFDEALLRALRLHHREGIRESEACQSGASHQELKSFCTLMVSAQQKEIRQINSWICEWAKDCTEK